MKPIHAQTVQNNRELYVLTGLPISYIYISTTTTCLALLNWILYLRVCPSPLQGHEWASSVQLACIDLMLNEQNERFFKTAALNSSTQNFCCKTRVRNSRVVAFSSAIQRPFWTRKPQFLAATWCVILYAKPRPSVSQCQEHNIIFGKKLSAAQLYAFFSAKLLYSCYCALVYDVEFCLNAWRGFKTTLKQNTNYWTMKIGAAKTDLLTWSTHAKLLLITDQLDKVSRENNSDLPDPKQIPECC